MNTSLQIELQDDIKIISISGRLDARNAQNLRDPFINEVRSHTGPILIDCHQLMFISSSGLAILLTAAQQSWANGQAIALCGLTEYIAAMFQQMQLSKLFTIYNTREGALLELNARTHAAG